jgi:hypothetical protein
LTLHDEREAVRETKWATVWNYTANTVARNVGQGRTPRAQRGVKVRVGVCVSLGWRWDWRGTSALVGGRSDAIGGG